MISKIFLASDHNGINIRHDLIKHADQLGILAEDLGIAPGSMLDYIDITNILAERMATESGVFGVLICGSGIGISIAANRYRHLRAALCRSGMDASLARQQNDANVLCLGAKFCDKELALKCFDSFVRAEFNKEKHNICVNKMGL